MVIQTPQQPQQKKKKDVPVIAIIIIVTIVACVLILFIVARAGLLNIPNVTPKLLSGKKTGKVDTGAETVDQESVKLRDFGSYVGLDLGGSGSSPSSNDSKSEKANFSNISPEDITSDGEYIFPNSDTEPVSESDIEALDNEQLRIAINEIYARYGYIFQTSQEMKDYFDNTDWYEPDPDMDDMTKVPLNKIEKKNLDKMVKERTVRKDNGDWPY